MFLAYSSKLVVKGNENRNAQWKHEMLRPSWWRGTRPAGRAQYLFTFINGVWNPLLSVMLLVCPPVCFGKALSLIWPCVGLAVYFRLDFAVPGFLSGISGLAGPTFISQWIYNFTQSVSEGVRAAFSPRQQPNFLDLCEVGFCIGLLQHQLFISAASLSPLSTARLGHGEEHRV